MSTNYSCRLDELVGLEGLVAEYRDQDSDLSFLDWLAAKAEAIVEEAETQARYEDWERRENDRASYWEMQHGF